MGYNVPLDAIIALLTQQYAAQPPRADGFGRDFRMPVGDDQLPDAAHRVVLGHRPDQSYPIEIGVYHGPPRNTDEHVFLTYDEAAGVAVDLLAAIIIGQPPDEGEKHAR